MLVSVCSVFFFKQKTAYEMRISDWSSDVCSSDLTVMAAAHAARPKAKLRNVTRVMVLPLLLECCSQFGQFPRGQRFAGAHPVDDQRSEERRVGKECVSTCRSRGSPYH